MRYVQGEVSEQLKAAKNANVYLKQMFDKANLETIKLRRNVARKMFGIELFQASDKGVHLYTGLPSTAVYDRLLEYLSPDGRCSNVVYRATAQSWTSACIRGMVPSEAEWRVSESQVG